MRMSLAGPGFALAAASVLLASPPLMAQDDEAGISGGTTTVEAREVTRGYLKDEKFSLKSLVGAVAFQDQSSTLNNTGRFAVGISLDVNAISMFSESRSWYLGPYTGIIYSHLGSPGSSFFGSNPGTTVAVGGGPGANLLIIPTDLKAGYNFNDSVRLSAHGGGNVIYRSVASSMALDPDSATSNSLWKYYPNAGADLEFGLGPNAALALRPDWTYTPAKNFFTGTLGLGITLG